MLRVIPMTMQASRPEQSAAPREGEAEPRPEGWQGQQGHISVRIPPGEVARAAIVLIGIGLGAYLLWRIQEVIFLILLAILLATAIEPLVMFLRRGPLSRGAGILVVYTVIVLAIGFPIFTFGPEVLNEATTFTNGLPQRIESLRPFAETLRPLPVREAVLEGINWAANQVRRPATPQSEQIVEAGATLAHTLINFVLVFVIAFYWMVERSTIKRAILRLVSPKRARDVNAIWLELEGTFGSWVRGLLVLMLAMGVMSGVGFYLMGLPSPLLLGVFAAFAEMIPIVGPVLAFVPAIGVALATDPTKVLWVVAFGIVVQLIENNVLVPRVMSHAVGVSALTVIIGIQIGAILYGLPGAVIAVPIAGAIQVMLNHLVKSEDSPQQSRLHAKGTVTAATARSGQTVEQES